MKERKKGACGLVNFIIPLICILMIAITSIIGLAQTGYAHLFIYILIP